MLETREEQEVVLMKDGLEKQLAELSEKGEFVDYLAYHHHRAIREGFVKGVMVSTLVLGVTLILVLISQ